MDPAFYGMSSPNFKERYFIAYDVDRTSDYQICGVGLTEEGSCPEPIMDESNCDDTDGGNDGAFPPNPAGLGSADGGSDAAASGSKAAGGCSTVAGTAAASWWLLVMGGWMASAGRRRS
jgi:hypothetical protein